MCSYTKLQHSIEIKNIKKVLKTALQFLRQVSIIIFKADECLSFQVESIKSHYQD